MLRKVVSAVLIIICFVLQCSVFGSLAFAGIIPNLMIILTSSFGFMCGEREGLLIGFFCGLLYDIFFGSFLGFYALLLVNTACYAKNNKDTLTRFDIAYATMGAVTHELTDLDGRSADIYAANDPTAAGRNELGKVLSETAESVIHAMNGAKSGSDFVFAGDDELNAPFTWNADRTILYYRGVNVNAGSVKSPAAAPV